MVVRGRPTIKWDDRVPIKIRKREIYREWCSFERKARYKMRGQSVARLNRERERERVTRR